MKKLLLTFIILIGISNSAYWGTHHLASKVIWDSVGLKVFDIEIGKPLAVMAGHRYIDRLIGESSMSRYGNDMTMFDVITMFIATPDKDKLEFLEIALYGYIIPDVLFKEFFHRGNDETIYKMDADQTMLLESFSVLIYVKEINF